MLPKWISVNSTHFANTNSFWKRYFKNCIRSSFLLQFAFVKLFWVSGANVYCDETHLCLASDCFQWTILPTAKLAASTENFISMIALVKVQNKWRTLACLANFHFSRDFMSVTDVNCLPIISRTQQVILQFYDQAMGAVMWEKARLCRKAGKDGWEGQKQEEVKEQVGQLEELQLLKQFQEQEFK